MSRTTRVRTHTGASIARQDGSRDGLRAPLRGAMRALLCACIVAQASLGQAGPPVSTSAADSRAQPICIPRSDTSVKVDGALDDAAWKHAVQFDLAYEFSPGENVPPPVRTEAFVTYDESTVYFAFRAFDPDPGGIQAHLSDRDSIWRDDQVGLEIDTFNDERRSYSIFINPLGIQEDAVASADGSFDFSWDAIWDARTQFYDWGYSAEIAIPFSSIRIQRSDRPQVWGVNLMRAYVRETRHDIGIVPMDRSNNCRHCQFVKVSGFDGVQPGRNIEITPTLTMQGSQVRPDFPDGELERGDRDAALGVTAQWGVTPNLTLAGTVNPDFSQIEADALALDINEPFALFYEERRPFFTEGADFFATRLNAVHTRTVRDPSWGIKLSGKAGQDTVGVFVVRDELTNVLLPGNQGSSGASLGMPSTAGIGRYARDLGRRFRVGAVVTGREAEDYFNRVAGADATLRMTDTDRIEAQVLASQTEYPDEIVRDHAQREGSFGGTAASVGYTHDARSLDWSARFEQIGHGFRSDLGFIPRVGYRDLGGNLEYTWNAEAGRWWERFAVGGSLSRSDDPDGGALDREGEAYVRFWGTRQSWLYAAARKSRETFGGSEFDKTSFEVSGRTKPIPTIELTLTTLFGDHIDYGSARLGQRTRIRPQLGVSLGKHLEVKLNHTFERLSVDGSQAYDAAVTEATLAYQFNARTFLRAIIQRTAYDYGPAAATADSRERSLFGQLLFSYKVNPRTVVFLGYVENALGTQDYSLTDRDRKVFVKLGYAWLM